VPRRKNQSGRISVLKGREARLNKTIFHILALKGPLTIYDVYKEVKGSRHLGHTKYTNVNRRVRVLNQTRYLRKIGVRPTLAGFKASLYELTGRGYAALVFDQVNLDRFIEDAEENEILLALGTFATQMPRSEKK
jgi:hypothetical protein